ncbi:MULTISPECIES: 3-dehydroquinate synthase [unclassified Flavobacterium]|uniref:3-dehydroquinate synthase n=1 Tax=unclassified Flavobacterium TaxID=196869 RepID=UPI001290A3A1|nr:MULTISPECIES: 3-dehydroquinate synthase [unclassified Flavobacterium]MQP52297.1 3-dehydroquinate synthase [Flavobacterium sp. LMO9]MQP62367.1 3-dehydroquinate synthase [Flavobacterium sp. LMO6]
MQTITATQYSVYFDLEGYETLVELLIPSRYSKIFILVDENTSQYCLPHLLNNLATEIEIEIIELEVGEIHKNIETCTEVWGALSELGGDRKSVLINLGGGVISDLGGFVACTFKRGIDFINIPTTLLSMVDASIGGKNGVDLGNLKNQIGIIREPKAVIVDTQFLNTLPQNEMRSGLAEMLKHGLIYDKKYWDKFKNLKDLSTDNLNELIHESIQIKNRIVCEDLTENGIRKSLNFGHTIGHAIESYFLENEEKTNLLHGEAIAIGMILESYISREKKLITNEEYQEIKYIINDIFERVEFNRSDIDEIIKLLIFDKKNEFGKVQFALLDGIGKIKINQETNNELIIKAFNDYFI